MTDNNNPELKKNSVHLTQLQAYQEYIQQIIERLRIIREESNHYNSSIAEQKYAEVCNLSKILKEKHKICEDLQAEWSQLQTEENTTKEKLDARKDCKTALIQSPMNRTREITAQYRNILTQLECSYSFDINSFSINLNINSEGASQPNHLTLSYTPETQNFKLISVQPEPVRLKEIREYIGESNDMPGLLFMWHKSCMKLE